MRKRTQDLEELEIHLLLEGIFSQYGYDFRDYAPVSLKRRILKSVQDEGLKTISGFQESILHDPECMDRFLLNISINVTEIFRDPPFFLAMREKVLPLMKSYPFLRIWHAGCSTGEEVYSMAILLEEVGLLKRSIIYATDMNEAVLKIAKKGIMPLKLMKDYTRNYLAAGGTSSFSDYYTARYDNAILRPSIREKIVWAQHNLVTDASFNEFNIVLCRNVMIYFNKSLQNRVHDLLHQSLAPNAVLGLGQRESMRFNPHESQYRSVCENVRLYRKVE
jgi:chemotaxis protein methyltransferase CheR